MKKSDISTYFGQIWQSHAKIIKLRLISSKKCKFNAEIQNCSLIQPRLSRNSAEIKYCYSHKGMSEWSDELFTYDSTVTISLYEIRWKTLKLRKWGGKKKYTLEKKIPLFPKRSEWVREKKNTAGKKNTAIRPNEWVSGSSIFSREKKIRHLWV